MPLSNPTIRRYTPPTCTLEVLAQSSPLSRWMGKSVLKELRFNLRFDDPRLPEDQRVTIKGSREQLEALCTVVTTYVQEILQSSPEDFWLKSAQAHTNGEVTDAEDSPTMSDQLFNSNSAKVTSAIYLQPSSHLAHDLNLGSLANQSSGPIVRLSLLQLFDLATAVDDYMADVVAIPSTTTRSAVAFPTWAPVAAVLLVSLGLAPLTWQYANRMRQQKTASTIAPAEEKLALETPLPFPAPLDGLSSPQPTIPGVAPDNSFSAPVPPNSTTTPVQVPEPPIPPNSIPSASTSLPNSVSKATLPSPGSNQSLPNLNANPTSNPSQEAISPKFGKNGSASINSSGLNLPQKTTPSTLSVPTDANTPTPSTPKVATTSNGSPGASNQKSSANPEVSSDELIAKLRSDSGKAPKNPANNIATGNTLSTQQVTEAQQYLTRRWQPPKGLKEPLEYSLTVGVDGSVEQILPLGKASRDYIERAGIPEIGKSFVSPNRNGQNTVIRAVLQPNGKVQTFAEEP